jgi:tetratricopeptide (TPR) repeat protein
MASRAFISRFSPNRTDPEVLEAIFVQRHRLAEVWLERLRDSVLTDVKHHLLAVGPRGCGKSHLVALLVSRLRKNPAVMERVRIAWLPEDETTPSFWKFLLRILRALNAEYGDEFPLPPRDQLGAASDDRRSAVLTDYLLQKLDGRTLLVVVENLDDVMRGLKAEGQKRWRAFLQEHAIATTLATSQQITPDLSDRESPFFNFFQIEYLHPLTTDEAVSLLRKIAEQMEKNDLAAFLQTPTGRARVRAIRHIAGGNHRIFITLSEFATRENLNDLLAAFMDLLDELTPYYQERLRWLPDQQREIVEFLCRQPQTVPVKEIARELLLTEQTAAAQLKQLKDKGYVTAESVGRESRYELAEPLMRLCVEVKDPQAKPIPLIVEFLRIWYDRTRVETLLQRLPVGADRLRGYIEAALEAYRPGIPDPIAAALNRDLEAARAAADPEAVVGVLVDLAGTSDSEWRCLAIAGELCNLDRRIEALAACNRAIELYPPTASAWSNIAWMLEQLGEYEKALNTIDHAIKLDPALALAWRVKGSVLNNLNRHVEALAAHDRACELNPGVASVWFFKGWALYSLGRDDEALAALDRATMLDANYAWTWVAKGMTLTELGRHQEAIAACDRAINLNLKSDAPWLCKGMSLTELGLHVDALATFDQAIELSPNSAPAWFLKGQTLRTLGRNEEALAAFDQAVELDPHSASIWACRGEALSSLHQNEKALAAFERAIELDPKLIRAWSCKLQTLDNLGRNDEAIAAVDQFPELDPNDPEAKKLIAVAKLLRCSAKAHLGREDEASHELFQAAVPDVIAIVFQESVDRSVWLQRISELADLTKKAHESCRPQIADKKETPTSSIMNGATASASLISLALLGDALVRSLTNPAYEKAAADAVDAWAGVWREVAERHPDLSLAVRLFSVGVRYVRSKDERVLLDLVQEERSILRDLFGLDDSTAEG